MDVTRLEHMNGIQGTPIIISGGGLDGPRSAYIYPPQHSTSITGNANAALNASTYSTCSPTAVPTQNGASVLSTVNQHASTTSAPSATPSFAYLYQAPQAAGHPVTALTGTPVLVTPNTIQPAQHHPQAVHLQQQQQQTHPHMTATVFPPPQPNGTPVVAAPAPTGFLSGVVTSPWRNAVALAVLTFFITAALLWSANPRFVQAPEDESLSEEFVKYKTSSNPQPSKVLVWSLVVALLVMFAPWFKRVAMRAWSARKLSNANSTGSNYNLAADPVVQADSTNVPISVSPPQLPQPYTQ